MGVNQQIATFSCHSISVSQIEKLNIASRLWNADIDVPFLFPAVQKWTAFSISKRKENFKSYEKDIEAISHRLPCLCDYRYRFADNGSPRFREAILDGKCRACRYR